MPSPRTVFLKSQVNHILAPKGAIVLVIPPGSSAAQKYLHPPRDSSGHPSVSSGCKQRHGNRKHSSGTSVASKDIMRRSRRLLLPKPNKDHDSLHMVAENPQRPVFQDLQVADSSSHSVKQKTAGLSLCRDQKNHTNTKKEFSVMEGTFNVPPPPYPNLCKLKSTTRTDNGRHHFVNTYSYVTQKGRVSPNINSSATHSASDIQVPTFTAAGSNDTMNCKRSNCGKEIVFQSDTASSMATIHSTSPPSYEAHLQSSLPSAVNSRTHLKNLLPEHLDCDIVANRRSCQLYWAENDSYFTATAGNHPADTDDDLQTYSGQDYVQGSEEDSRPQNLSVNASMAELEKSAVTSGFRTPSENVQSELGIAVDYRSSRTSQSKQVHETKNEFLLKSCPDIWSSERKLAARMETENPRGVCHADHSIWPVGSNSTCAEDVNLSESNHHKELEEFIENIELIKDVSESQLYSSYAEGVAYSHRKKTAKKLLSLPDCQKRKALEDHFWIIEDEPLKIVSYEVGGCVSSANKSDGGTQKKSLYRRKSMCHICGSMLRSKSGLKDHINTHMNIKNFCCHFCARRFTHATALKAHIRIHSGEKPYRCSECSLHFRTLSSIQKHRSKHSSVRPFECVACSRKFKTKTSLQRHLKTHLSGPHVCSICGQTFEKSKAYNSHYNSHHRHLHPCPHCGRMYKFPALLKKHQKVHSGVKDMVCSICSATFVWESSLAAHMKMHSASRLPCPTCGKTFLSQKKLDHHMIKHMDPKPHQCNCCGKKFQFAYSLAAHAERHCT